MLPTIALVGRPNVGKSTLFNSLTKSNDALILDLPGTTRDRQYGTGKVGEYPYILVDTGGVGAESDLIDQQTHSQSWSAVAEADYILFLVDGQVGVTELDLELAKKLRQINKTVQLVVNKTDKINIEVALAEFYELGVGEPFPISAIGNKGVNKLAALFLSSFKELSIQDAVIEDNNIKVAVVGQPNVGKSTLLNQILQDERLVVSEVSGTTRDTIYIPFTRYERNYSLIDTAGIRRKGKINQTIEKYSVIKSLQAIEVCNVAVLLIDSSKGVTAQDLSLLEFIIEQGRALVILFNKWDLVTKNEQQDIKNQITDKLHFAQFAKQHFISAITGKGLGKLFTFIDKAYDCATQDLSTSKLTKILTELITTHQPPIVHSHRIKLRYAHSGGKNPPRIVIHGNQTEHVPLTYKRYLIKGYINALKLEGTPLKIHFKTSDNPYEGKKNELTNAQLRKRKRAKKLFSWIKKKN